MKSNASRIIEVIQEASDDAIIADGFDDALIGHTTHWDMIPETTAVYSVEKVLQILMERDGMTDEEALEFFYFNIGGAWMGKQTPIFVWTEE